MTPSATTATGHKSPRLQSLDAFRGLDIIIMILVNFLAGMQHIPQFLLHLPGTADGYTLADLVFPGFLFIVGISIPFALSRRQEQGEKTTAILKHILIRSAGLILIGVLLLNGSEYYSAQVTGLNKNWWMFLVYSGIVLLWMNYPAKSGSFRVLIIALQLTGALLLISAMIIFRGKCNGQIVWLQHGWWGILGIIGWSYAIAAIIWLQVRGKGGKIVAAVAVLILLYTPLHSHLPDWLQPLNKFLALGPLATHTAMVLAGAWTGNIIMQARIKGNPHSATKILLATGIIMLTAGYILRPLHGFSKIRCTDSFALAATGISMLTLLLLYYIVDVRGLKKTAAWLLPVGINPLLAYLLPGIFGVIVNLTGCRSWFWPFWTTGGLYGFVNSLLITGLMIMIVALLTRTKLILRL